jgi:hypothetical protein
MVTAWSLAKFRDDVIYELARSVSKVGSFELADEYWLQLLPRFLTKDQSLELYEAIRDESQRLELEWRGLFESAFPQSVGFLPSSRDGEFVREALWSAIETGDGRPVEDLINILPQIGDGARILRETGRDGKTLVQAARERQQTLVTEMLERAEKDLEGS